ncbi:MAG: hypothetical protein KTR14_07460 [Vampirovibrio sp.]|nr:hypothetical protein [Vampirovibrio sp.]
MMPVLKNRVLSSLLLFTVIAGSVGISAISYGEKDIQVQAAQAAKAAVDEAKEDAKEASEEPETPLPPDSAFTAVDPIELVKTPTEFQDKYVTFEGNFSQFSGIFLDYKKAFRDSKDFVAVLIDRPDTGKHHIPMSELKMFFPRKKSEDVMHLESGDKVLIKAKVFSSALNDPWVDVLDIQIVEKANKDGKKEKMSDPDCC